jgi:hypothetical protein
MTAERRTLATARRRIGKRDPDDVDVLALHLNFAVWSNDNDFEDAGVEWHTTAELLKALADCQSNSGDDLLAVPLRSLWEDSVGTPDVCSFNVASTAT